MGALIYGFGTVVSALSQLIHIMIQRNSYTKFQFFGTRPKVAPLR